jgi:hypothetical protein
MRYRIKAGVLLFTIIFVNAFYPGSSRAVNLAGERSTPAIIGGPCEWQYKGRAMIVSVSKKERPENYGGPSYES